MMKPVELHPASSLLCPHPHRGRGQAVVFPAHHQRGEDRRAVGPAPPSLCRRRAVGGFALAEGADVAAHHHPDALRALHLLLVDSQAADGGLEERLVEVAVGHGAVEAADGPDAHGEGLRLQRPPDGVVARGLQRGRGRGAEPLRLRLVEPPPLLRPRSRRFIHDSCQS